MRSKFSLRTFLLIMCLLVLLCVFMEFIHLAVEPGNAITPFQSIFTILFLSFIASWLFFGEFRTKMIWVELDDEVIKIRRFGGLGPVRTYLYKELSGYKTSILLSQSGQNEYMYIFYGERKIGKLSDAYHKNYDLLKPIVATKLQYLGFEKFSFLNEIKESFS